MFCNVICQEKHCKVEKRSTHAIDDEVQIPRRDGLPVQQTISILDSANTPARLLHNHHLLDHLFLISIQEVRKFLSVKGSVQFQETAKSGSAALGSDI